MNELKRTRLILILQNWIISSMNPQDTEILASGNKFLLIRLFLMRLKIIDKEKYVDNAYSLFNISVF